ncbi:CYTH domain-containing protein [Lachnospiraceae bacterium G11]|nr:CYTH domain-containing protein [Lachnospiraceae bacterium]SDA71041.1 CYTH domain-containing protein [Lachnospiraceae bacterium G11]
MEIERKFTVKTIPEDLSQYPCKQIEQAYLNTDPVVRVRREDDKYTLTYKGKGLMAREEFTMDLNKESYYHLAAKADGNIISKKRYIIPLKNPKFREGGPQPPADYTLTIELDVFDAPFDPLIIAEIEFGSTEAAEAFVPPEWFYEDVTYDTAYHNSTLSTMKF